MSDHHVKQMMCYSRLDCNERLPYENDSDTMKENVDHSSFLVDQISNLCLSEELSDVTLVIGGTRIPAHKLILSTRSRYFRALFGNGMKESIQNEVTIVDASIDVFKIVLKYIYSGKIQLGAMSDLLLINLFELAHEFGFEELEAITVNRFEVILCGNNLCEILTLAKAFNLENLLQTCLSFADNHALCLVKSSEFLTLTAESIEQLISRNSFYCPEFEIFEAIKKYIILNKNEPFENLIRHVRLSLISFADLIGPVRDSKLFNTDDILDALKEISFKRSDELNIRGLKLLDVNVVSPKYDARVICGEVPAAMFAGRPGTYEIDQVYTKHTIESGTEGIIIELNKHYTLNHILLMFMERFQSSYSYHIETSNDSKAWLRVIDYSEYTCRSVQKLFFRQRVVKYIRIRGTDSKISNTFHIVYLEALFKTNPAIFDPITGIVIPSENVATIPNNAIVTEGVARKINCLLDGDIHNYDLQQGYVCHQIGAGCLTIELSQPYLLSSMKLLLWDCDERYYQYYIEVSCNGKVWKRIVDKTQEECKSWQHLTFPQQPIVFIKIVGTYNSANEVFHCVHFECPAVTNIANKEVPNQSNYNVSTSGINSI
uniref:BTB domain-containing protein n=1 Tax=Rhabditophanes sp. KR3021 TaxID=114890 RepID=A0AC35TJB4_9BILA